LLFIARPPCVWDDEVDVLSGGPMLLFKVIPTGYGIPYGGAPVTGLTNLLYEVNASRDTFSLQPVYSIRLLQIEYNHRQASFIPSPSFDIFRRQVCAHELYKKFVNNFDCPAGV
jgi:hypothetical protein